MINEIGFIALALSTLAAVFAVGAALWGIKTEAGRWLESARNAAITTAPLLTLACAVVIYGLVTGDFQVRYVYDVSSRTMPSYLKAMALWGGQAGSILFWTWLMSLFAAVAIAHKWNDVTLTGLNIPPFRLRKHAHGSQHFMGWVIVVTMMTLIFFQALALFVANPFERLWHAPASGQIVEQVWQPAGFLPLMPADGKGLNPLLRHPGMIGHPPTLYLGFTGFVIPYAFAMAALITGRSTDDAWIRTTRRWTLVAWLFLSLGLLLGGRWAYDVLGWGGFWGWDPVENAALMPWLTGTAFLHSVMIQEKRGMLKVWNMVLIILTYSLVIFGTFITRSGVISSVHSFAQSAIGPAFFGFITITFLASLTLLVNRLDTLQSENQLDSLLSRESAFLLNNVLFLGIAFAVFWGTVSPLISELVTGQAITVGPPYYNQVTGPLFGAILLLMGLAPLMAWRRQSIKKLRAKLIWPFLGSVSLAIGLIALGHRHVWGLLGVGLVTFVGLITLLEFWKGARARHQAHGEAWPVALARLMTRNRRRYGGYLIHLGVLMMALGVLGTNFYQQETQTSLRPGEQLTVGPYTLRFDGLRYYTLEDGDRQVTQATLSVYANGRRTRTLEPRRDFFPANEQPLTIPAVWSRPQGDVYTLLLGWEDDWATFRVYLNPLVMWLWVGGVAFIVGTLVAAWPEPATARRWTLAPQREPAVGPT